MVVPPIAEPASPHNVAFPFNIRAAMLGWKNLFFAPVRFVPDDTRSERWNRGNFLANGPAHCSACHTPRNFLGGREDHRAFEGGSGTPGGRVPGITPGELVAENYDIPALVDTLKTGFTPGFNLLGAAMGEVIEESTSHWTDADLEAISAYLLDED
jgi:mono/diheme cytochrome c family protein